jgi:tetratricopeptide (TPR) repeat protein
MIQSQIMSKATDGTYMPVKKLNTSGDEIMARNGFWPPLGEIDYNNKSKAQNAEDNGVSKIVDVAEGEEGTWSIIDQKRSRIYTYDKNGSLLFAFGEAGNMMGSIVRITAITYQGDKMLVLDSSQSTNNFTVFKREPYGDTILEAIAAENDQDFDTAINKWTDVLKSNSNFDAAYVGIGQAMYRNGDYKKSLEYFESAYDTENWSNSYKEIRKEWMSNYFLVLIAIIGVVIAAVTIFNKFVTRINKEAAVSGKKKTFGEELAYGFHIILHPFDGFWDLKHEKRGSVRASIVFIVVTILAFFYQSVGSGYLINPEGNYGTIWGQALSVLVPLFLFIVANWCLTTLFEGEGSFKDIFIACSYSLLPLPLLIIPVTIYSNFCIQTEISIINLITTFAFIWLALLIFFGTQVTHDYSMGKNVITIAGTAVAMVFIMFIAILFSTLVTKMVGLVTNIVTEIQFRL